MLLVQTSLQIADTSVTVTITESRIFLSFCYKAHSHQVAMMSISYLDEPTLAIFRDAKKISVRVCATTCFSHMPVGQCDTTARLYGISKNVLLNRLSADDTFMQKTRNFWSMTVETTTTAGGQWSHWGDRDETFDHLRYSRFPRKVSSDKTAAVMASSLLPTSSSAKYHPFPAYYQIRQYGYRQRFCWSNRDHGSSEMGMEPSEWRHTLRR